MIIRGKLLNTPGVLNNYPSFESPCNEFEKFFYFPPNCFGNKHCWCKHNNNGNNRKRN